jgi:hypothetical protein
MRRDSGSRGDIERTFNQRTISSAAYNKRERERERERGRERERESDGG